MYVMSYGTFAAGREIMRCHFCKVPAVHRCTFKQPDPRIVFPGEIEPLDFVRDDLTLVYRPVKIIRVWPDIDYALVKFTGEHKALIERYVNVRLPCLRMEIHECGFQVCENHVRELDEGLLVCMEHWADLPVYSVA